jgi:hypothetical protein
MSFWNDVLDWLGFGHYETQDVMHDDNCINPVNGLPMVGGCSRVDIQGNPYGMDNCHTYESPTMDPYLQSENWSNFDDGFRDN